MNSTPVFLIGDQIKININGIIYTAVVYKYMEFYKTFFCKIIQKDGTLNHTPPRLLHRLALLLFIIIYTIIILCTQ